MKDDPFAKLGALDQKLFTAHQQPGSRPDPAQSSRAEEGAPPEPKEPRNQAFKQERNQGTLEARKLPAKPTGGTEAVAIQVDLDLNQRPDRQNTYAFTTDELERLEDLKILICRHYDLSITKNDLIRCAVHLLLDDFESAREGSAVLTRLRQKKAR